MVAGIEVDLVPGLVVGPVLQDREVDRREPLSQLLEVGTIAAIARVVGMLPCAADAPADPEGGPAVAQSATAESVDPLDPLALSAITIFLRASVSIS